MIFQVHFVGKFHFVATDAVFKYRNSRDGEVYQISDEAVLRINKDRSFFDYDDNIAKPVRVLTKESTPPGFSCCRGK